MMLIGQGLHVSCKDDWDIGLSRLKPEGTTYTLADMAEDVREVLDSGGIERATIIGRLMGGMIAQYMVLDHPELDTGLVPFYTTPTLKDVTEDVFQGDIVAPQSREEAVGVFIAGNQDTASPAYPDDEPSQRLLAGQMYDRGTSQSGIHMQREAIQHLPDVTATVVSSNPTYARDCLADLRF